MSIAQEEISGFRCIPALVTGERRGADRRRVPTPMLSRFMLGHGRRRIGRRLDDLCAFVDQHGSGLFLVATAILALNILDAFFTVLFLSYGGQELNPVVEWILGFGTFPFIGAKSVGIGVCIGFLTLTKNFRAARVGLAITLVGYSALLGWHLYLLGHPSLVAS